MAAHLVVLVICMLLQPWLITKAANALQKTEISKPNCTNRCGDVNIPYPFGIEAGCYMNEWFRVTCQKDNSNIGSDSSNPKPFINSINLELLDVSFSSGTVLVSNPVSKLNCSNNNGLLPFSINLESSTGSGSPFFFSNVHNRFASTGCGRLTTIVHNQTDMGGCLLPDCSDDDKARVNGCQVRIPPNLNSFVAKSIELFPGRDEGNNNNNSCGSAFMIADTMLNPDGSLPGGINNLTHVPAVLQWSIPKHSICDPKGGSYNMFCDGNGFCWTNLSSTHFCVCSKSYHDNTQLSNDCQAFDKCSDHDEYKFCQMLCLTTPGKFNCSSPCPDGYESYTNACYPKKLPKFHSKMYRFRPVIISCTTCMFIGTIVQLMCSWWSWRVANKRKDTQLRQKYFKRNGGLLVQQILSSHEGKVEKARLFTSKELENATVNFNRNRILGEGGQGTVYKGMLADGSIVAIKKPKLLPDEKKLEQFINEMIILSQINHRNVVKLLGCCLETEVPLLVYEFVINGTLSKHIHEENEEFPITWEMRLRIATEVANALSYLHSAASVPIYHRDIKSNNILLDDKYRAKVSDFGTSRSISCDQTHLTTQVQGTFGYLDPEYFHSSHFTEKSDVYSFGVVLFELLTGEKPICSTQTEEVKTLVPQFLISIEEHSLFDVVDPRVRRDGSPEEIIAVANLAKRCLNRNGKKRPTMKEVAMELELIRVSKGGHYAIHQKDEDHNVADSIESWSTVTAASTSSATSCSITWSLDARD